MEEQIDRLNLAIKKISEDINEIKYSLKLISGEENAEEIKKDKAQENYIKEMNEKKH